MTNGMIKCTQKETKNKYTIKERKKIMRDMKEKKNSIALTTWEIVTSICLAVSAFSIILINP